MTSSQVSRDKFRSVLSSFPAGVTITTAVDESGRMWGFTASAFTSVSLDPPLILVCVDKGADSYGPIVKAPEFCVNILSTQDSDLATRFATKAVDKFAGDEFNGREFGVPILHKATGVLVCRRWKAVDAGDHTVLIGMVLHAEHHGNDALVYHARQFKSTTPL